MMMMMMNQKKENIDKDVIDNTDSFAELGMAEIKRTVILMFDFRFAKMC